VALAGDELRHEPADTIYFGGGTPSLLSPDEVAGIIEACREAFPVMPGAEVTLEANPETVTLETLRGFLAAGVNRMSVGVQSFRDAELRRLGRLHDARRAAEALALAREAGCGNVSLDLMMWLPGQSVEEWRESVDRAAALSPEHVSMYILELYPNAPLRDEMARGGWSLAPDDDAAAMYLEALDRMESSGLCQYEISNVCVPGLESRHNLKYWSGGRWLGLGCGAHSTVGARRWKNVAATSDYIDRVERGASVKLDEQVMDADERLGEALFTGLRLAAGVDMDELSARFGQDVWARFGRALEPARDAGLVVREGASLRLTRRGMLLANEVMSVFV
jgi:oxygen-independent coproporphyrinogen-3 oxidase